MSNPVITISSPITMQLQLRAMGHYLLHLEKQIQAGFPPRTAAMQELVNEHSNVLTLCNIYSNAILMSGTPNENITVKTVLQPGADPLPAVKL